MKKEVILVISIIFLISLNLVSAFNFEDRIYGLETEPPTIIAFDNNTGFVNKSNFWDDLDTPIDINFDDLTWSFADDWNYISGGDFTFNESKLAITYYNATSIDVIEGTDNTNDLATLQTYDGITYNISEDTGAPGMDVRINFTDVNDFNQLTIRMRTTSGGKHRYKIQIYDYDEIIWEDYTNFVEIDIFKVIDLGVYDASSHISGGVVQIRFYLEESGVPAHEVFIDWISLSDGISTYSTNEIDPLSFHRGENMNLDGWNITNIETLQATHLNITATSFLQTVYATSLTTSTLHFEDSRNLIWDDGGTALRISSFDDVIISAGLGGGIYTFGSSELDLGDDNIQTRGFVNASNIYSQDDIILLDDIIMGGAINEISIDGSTPSVLVLGLRTIGEFRFISTIQGSLWTITDSAVTGRSLTVSGNSELNQPLLTTSNVTHDYMNLTGSATVKKVDIGNSIGTMPFIVTATIEDAGTTNIYDSNAPIAFRVIKAWSINKAATAGKWKVTDGTNDVVLELTTQGLDKMSTPIYSVASTALFIDDDYDDIAIGGTLAIVNDNTFPANCTVYIMLMPT